MKKRIYRAVDVKVLETMDWDEMSNQAGDEPLILAVDVAKETMFGALMTREKEVIKTLKWRHPQQSKWVVEQLAKGLESVGVEAIMEPSGTYGDALRWLYEAQGWPVYRVNPKRSFDAKEVYDGVPSLHDAKSCYVIGRLHLEGCSEPWVTESEARRELNAQVKLLDMYQDSYQRALNRLEAVVSRHWPELGGLLDLSSVCLLEVLSAYGSPQEVQAHEAQAEALLRRVGRSGLKPEKRKLILESAREMIGVPCIQAERDYVMSIAQEARRLQLAIKQREAALEEVVTADAGSQEMRQLVGVTTTAVLIAKQGHVQNYPSASSYRKAIGINLKEKSSGNHQGQLGLTKRGPSMSRKYLYFAALRLIQKNKVVRAWYEQKVCRDGGLKKKAITAVMRKLATALWHVGRGERFDAAKLFNTQALSLVD